MRTSRSIVFSLGLLVATLMAGCASDLDAAALKASQAGNRQLFDEVVARCAQMEQAMRDNDLAKVASFYADDGILLNSNGQRQGGSRQALEEYWQGFGQGVDWSLITHSVEGVDGLIVQRGKSVLTYISPGDDERRTGIVEFILLWQRDDEGELKIAVDGYW